jgi:hypothetical protein
MGVSAVCWQYGIVGTILSLISKMVQFFTGYLNGCALDLSLILPSPGGSAGTYGY